MKKKRRMLFGGSTIEHYIVYKICLKEIEILLIGKLKSYVCSE
jgi:hypothetical protein